MPRPALFAHTVRITAGLNFMEQPCKRTVEGFIYWLSTVILIWFLPLVNFFLQNTPSWDWESFSDSSWILMWSTFGDHLTCVFFLPFSHQPLPLPLRSSGENGFPGFTVGLTCLLISLLTQWLMVHSAVSLDLVNIRNCSQISVISDSLWAEKWDSLPDTKASGLG